MTTMNRVTRNRRLTPQEGAKYKAIREQVAGELPDLIARHHERVATLGQLQELLAQLKAAREAKGLSSSGAGELSERCYARILWRQRPDGSFAYTTGDYGFLRDGRSYPRPQVMTLFHLLYPAGGNGFERKVAGG